MSYPLNRIIKAALLTAVTFVLSRYLDITTNFLSITFSFVPIALCGLLYGPLWGGGVAALADVLGAVIVPQGSGGIHLGFTLTAFLTGVVFGLFLHRRPITWWRVTVPSVLVCMLLNVGLNTFWLYTLLGPGAIAALPTRIIKNLSMIAVQIVVLLVLPRLLQPLIEGEHTAYKNHLRRRARTLFRNAEVRAAVSDGMTRHVLSDPAFQNADTVFCFVGTEREPDTVRILEAALGGGKRVCVPLCGENGVMTARGISSLDELVPGMYGILEPSGDAPVVPQGDIDIALIPVSACDRSFGRIGKGAGYYDRFLADSGIYKLALCPRELIVWRLPQLATDVPMDAIATEDGIRRK